MQVLVVEFNIKPEHIEAFRSAIVRNAQSSMALEGGCRQFDVCVYPAHAGRFLLYEVYDDEAAVQAHLASAHFREMDALTAGWILDKTVTRLERVAG